MNCLNKDRTRTRRLSWRRRTRLLFGAALLSVSASAQTTLIGPANGGNFDLGSTFASNNWTVAQGAANPWVIGTLPTGAPFAGNSAYPSQTNAPADWTFNITTTGTTSSYLYRDVAVPAGESIITLSFNWQGQGEASWDLVQFFAAPTSVTPPSGGTHPGSGTSNVPAAITGATFLANTAPGTSGVQTVTVSIPASFAGTTMRLIVLWKSDTSGGVQPPVAIDNVLVTSALPVAYTANSLGGLWSSPATWVGGVVPPAGNDVVIPSGAIVTADQVLSYRDLTVSGTLQWNGTTNAATFSRDVLVNSGGNLNMFTAGSAPTGIPMNVGRSFTNNGTVNAAYQNTSSVLLNFNDATQNATLTGSGTFVGGIIDRIFFQTLGSSTISTTNPITVRSIAHAAANLNTNGKLSIDNTAQFYGTAANQQVYEVAVTNMGSGYNTATPPTVTIAAPTGVGTTATATPIIDDVTGTLRAIQVTSAGSGYRVVNPAVTITGGTGTGAAATAVVPTAAIGIASALFQKGANSTISGGINITSSQGVSAISTTGGGVGYTAAPTVGFTLPTGFLNLVTAPGSGYSTAPTVTVSGGTNINAGTNPTFTVTIASGQVTAVLCTGAGTGLWTVPPTLTLTAGTTTATAAFPSGPTGCLPLATANLNNEMVSSFTITNAGYGYAAAPTVGFGTAGFAGTFTTAATAPTCRIGLYNLTYGFFAPATSNPTFTEGAEVPTNRRINVLTMNTSNGGTFTSNLELYNSAPLTLTAGRVNMGSNTLDCSHMQYTGQAGSAATSAVAGTFRLRSPGGQVTRNFPFEAGAFILATGSTTNPASGATSTIYTVTQTGAPSTAPAVGTRAYRLQANGTYGVNPQVTMNWIASDNLVSLASDLRILEGSSLSGPWTARNIVTGTGFIGTTGNRQTATGAPGPIAPGSDSYYAWGTTTVPPAGLNFVVTRTTGNAYTSIASTALGGDNSGTASSVTGDEGTQSVTFPGGMSFTYQGSPCTGFMIHSNGFIQLQNAYHTPVSGNSWDNTLAGASSGTSLIAKRNIVAPMYDDYNKASPVCYYKFVGNVATIEWTNTTPFGVTGVQLNFQVVLDGNDNSITFNYGNLQAYNGSGNVRYSYTCGLSGVIVDAIPLAGQVFQQQYENTTYFTHENAAGSSRGANGLAIAPAARSSIKFVPGTYVPVAAPSNTPPANDEPVGAITRPALTAFPTNIAWDNGTGTTNYYTSRNATATASPAACSPNTLTNGKDVWFKFNAVNPNATVRIYASGGYVPRVEVWDNALTTSLACVTSAQGGVANVNLLTLTPGLDYYVRVYHDLVGTTALATATVASGAVTGITVGTPGTNYTVPPATFTGFNAANQGPMIRISGGGGNGAAASLITPNNAIPTAAVVASLTGSNLGFIGGAGYTSAPTVTIESPDWGVTGEFGIVIFSAAPNDECSGAIALSNLSNSSCVLGQNARTGNTGSATGSAQATVCGTPDDDVWYSFTATATTSRISTIGDSGFDPAVQVFDGGVAPGNCGTMASVSCLNNTGIDGTEQTDLTTVVGNTYFVRVYHAGTGTAVGANYTLCVRSITCFTPTGLAVAGVTSTSGSVIWNNNGSSNGYDIEIRTSGNPGDPGAIDVGDNVAGDTTYTSAVALTPNTNYTVYVRGDCGGINGTSDWSAGVALYTGYCLASNTVDTDNWLENFSTTNANTNISHLASGFSANGYGDFTGMILTEQAGGTFDFAADFAPGSGTYGLNIWVDFNNDLDFNDVDEKLYDLTPGFQSTHSGTLTVPVTATPGTYRMRVRASWSPADPLPCGDQSNSETEDFTFVVCAPPVISGTLNDNCVGQNFSVAVQHTGTTSGTLFWSVNGGAEQSVALEGDGNTNTGTITPIDASVTVRVVNASGCSATAGPFVSSCPWAISCASPTPETRTHCYNTNDTKTWYFKGGTGSNLAIKFTAGELEGADVIEILDGAPGDITANVVQTFTAGGPLNGQAFVNLSNEYMGIRFVTDGAGSCVQNTSPASSITFQVRCAGCEEPTGELVTPLVANCSLETFNIQVNVLGMGLDKNTALPCDSIGIRITVGANAPVIHSWVYTTGVVDLGNYPLTTPIDVELLHQDQAGQSVCNNVIATDATVGYNACPPPNDLCTAPQTLTVYTPGSCVNVPGTTRGADQTGANPTCGGAVQDVWYQVNSTGYNTLRLNITDGTATVVGAQLFTACGTPVAGACATDVTGTTPFLANNLAAGTYLLRVFTTVAGAGSFNVCITGTGVPGANCGAYSATPNLAIADVTTTTTTMVVPSVGGQVIGDLNVYMRISHTFPGDMRPITLTSPAGTVVNLVPPTTGACGTNDTVRVEYNDEGIAPVGSICPMVGYHAVPFEALSAFDLEAFEGTWTLSFTDAASGDVGTLTNWCLIPTLVAPVQCDGPDQVGTSTGPASVCQGGTVNLTNNAVNSELGITRKWWRSTVSATGPWVAATGTGATTQNFTTAALTTPGNNYFALSFGCANTPGDTLLSNVVTVMVNATPVVSIAPTPASAIICGPTGGSVSLVATGASTYVWSPTTGLTPNTGTSGTRTASPTATTTYTVTGTSAAGCPGAPVTQTVTRAPLPSITSTTATPSTACTAGTSQLQVNLAAPSAYCTAAATSTSFEKIGSVDLSNISNTSSSTAGYENFTAVVGNITAGTNYTLTVGISGAWAADFVHVWIDRNQDGVFADPGEKVFTGDVESICPDCQGVDQTLSGTINLPAATTVNGSTRMRIRLEDPSSTGNQTPCGTHTFGQVEDYTLNISGATGAAYTYSWAPNVNSLSSTTIANPMAQNVTATQTYTVSATNSFSCTSTSTVTLTHQPAANAGSNGAPQNVCANGSAFNLFNLLGGSPQTTGTWSPALSAPNGHLGTFTPGTDAAGTYTYTVLGVGPCANATATVSITYNTTDTDGDGSIDCVDDCDNQPGVIGGPCDFLPLAPGFQPGIVSPSCTCLADGCSEYVTLDLRPGTDGNSDELSWEVLAQATNTVVASGGGYIEGITTPITEPLCLSDGCYRLRVIDAGGDGIVGGGYQLRETFGQQRRIIDNFGNFGNLAGGPPDVSAIASTYDNGAFCVPMGNDRPIFASCDKQDWVASQFIVATENVAVSAQYGVGNQTDDGYEFWFYDPNGTYSFRRFRNHATGDGTGTGALRACHFRINGWTNSVATPHLPTNVLLNVRIRGRVNGVNTAFGPACLFKIDPVRATCPLVKLQDNPLNTADYSCGVSRVFGGVNSNSNKLVANPPQFMPAIVASNLRYQFRFRLPGEYPNPGSCIVRPIQLSPTLYLNWTTGDKLRCNTPYQVDLRVSKDGGVTWCVADGEATCSANPTIWGKVCTVSITTSTYCPISAQGGASSLAEDTNGELLMFPNPNRGDQLTLSLSRVEAGVNTVSVDIFDMTGKRVVAQTIAAQDGFLKTTMDLNGDLAGGMYMVNITAGEKTYTQRLVIQP